MGGGDGGGGIVGSLVLCHSARITMQSFKISQAAGSGREGGGEELFSADASIFTFVIFISP